MIKKIYYNWNKMTWRKKLGIGISIFVILRAILFIFDVNAEEPMYQPSVGFEDPNTNEILKIEDLYKTNNYTSNFIEQNTLDSLQQGKYNIRYYGDIIDSNNIKQNTFETYNQITSNENSIIGQNYYINKIEIENISPDYDYTIQPLDQDGTYSFLLQIGQDGLKYLDRLLYKKDIDISLIFDYKYEENVLTSTLNSDSYTLKYFEYFTPTFYDNEYVSYIQITFQLDREYMEEHYESDNGKYSLNKLIIECKNNYYEVNDLVSINSYNYFYKNDNNINGNIELQKLYIGQDVNIILTEEDYQGMFAGVPINQAMCKSCSNPLDIACQVERIVCYLKNLVNNLIYSIVQMLNYVFVPDFSKVKVKIDTLKDSIYNKFPDIIGLIDYAQYMKERFDNVQSKTTISFNGVKLPGYNQSWVIPPFTYDFNDVINNREINTYYQIVRAVITVLLCLGYGLLSFNIISSIWNGVSNEIGGKDK